MKSPSTVLIFLEILEGKTSTTSGGVDEIKIPVPWAAFLGYREVSEVPNQRVETLAGFAEQELR